MRCGAPQEPASCDPMQPGKTAQAGGWRCAAIAETGSMRDTWDRKAPSLERASSGDAGAPGRRLKRGATAVPRQGLGADNSGPRTARSDRLCLKGLKSRSWVGRSQQRPAERQQKTLPRTEGFAADEQRLKRTAGPANWLGAQLASRVTLWTEAVERGRGPMPSRRHIRLSSLQRGTWRMATFS